MMIFPIRIEMANVMAVQRPHDADARKHRRAVTAIRRQTAYRATQVTLNRGRNPLDLSFGR
jgi:hypothetical protein